ncbi:MAG: RCC1 domain-containing protein, partial [Persicimonas sp.]
CWGDDVHGLLSPPTDETFTEIALGPYHGCGVTEAGAVRCWGEETGLGSGYTTPPSDLSNVVEVSVGYKSACTLDDAGTIQCWGEDTSAFSELPSDLEFASVSMNPLGAGCATTVDGDAYCWHLDDTDTLGWAPTRAAFVDVTAAGSYACGLKEDGTFSCWGEQPGRPQGPSHLYIGTDFVEVDAGNRGICARRADGRVDCWGGLEPPSHEDFSSIDLSSEQHACGVREGGELACWGSEPDRGAERPDGEFIDVSAGKEFNCAVRSSGDIVCWGDTDDENLTPPDGGDFVEVDVDQSNACARSNDGTIACWGTDNIHSFDGQDEAYQSLDITVGSACALTEAGQISCQGSLNTPEWLGGVARIDAQEQTLCWLSSDRRGRCNSLLESPTADLSTISAGGRHACSLRPDGRVTCWNRGRSSDGELEFPGGTGFVDVAAAGYGGCALGSDGRPECWGANTAGGVSPPPNDDYVSLDAEKHHHCGVRDNGEVDCWTYSDQQFEHLDFGPSVDLPDDLTGPLDLAMGESHGCVLDAGGEIHCFGEIEQPTGCDSDGDGGEVCWGDPDQSDRFEQLACGTQHCCALQDDHTAYCWGNGPGTRPPGDEFVEIAAGYGFSCGTRPDQTLRCWGSFVADSWSAQ